MNDIFIDSNKNDQLSLLRGVDLQELLNETEHYLLKYRKNLGIPENITFGIEIEYEGITKILTDIFIKTKLRSWTSKTDGSLSIGGEITSPVMTDDIEYWKQLKKLCNNLTRRGADTTKKAGGHIHLGASILYDDIEAWQTFLKLYIAYENILFRFMYGDKINGRKGIIEYAKPTANILYRCLPEIKVCKSMSDLFDALPTFDRYKSLNFRNVNFNFPSPYKNTIEFRGPNATTNPIIWQNNINAFAKMINSSKTKKIDTEFLDYKLAHEYISYDDNKYLYECVNLKNVLEFIDLVFDNNLDKIYFLRQYLKNFQEVYNSNKTLKSKIFTR